MILPIYTYGQPVLREESKPVDKDTPDIKQLVNDMFETMYKADGIGLAAPQIGRPIRLFVIDANVLAKDYIECKDFKRVMINPEIIDTKDEKITLEEGCLSFPGIYEKVARFAVITVRYADENLNIHEETLEGFVARVVQHECEHLEGQIFIDNISPIRKQLNKGKLNDIIKGTAKCSYRIKTVLK